MELAHPDRYALKRKYYLSKCAADTRGELQQLKQQYEFALRIWGEYQFPVHNGGTAGGRRTVPHE
jgi:hypothetical protein